MTSEEFYRGLSTEISRIFKTHPELTDHRVEHNWLTGSLGNPFSGIWFVSMYPSKFRAEQIPSEEGTPLDAETQWSLSLGDQLLRRMLVKHGFKGGTTESPGQWNCYLTTVIKELISPKEWNAKSRKEQFKTTETWCPVLEWELDSSMPRLVVAMGKGTNQLLQHLKEKNLVRLPRLEEIENYAYVASRPRGSQPPMHPQRLQEYDEQFARLAHILPRL